MTDRKWRIVEEMDRIRFYDKITKYESEEYEVIPESFGYEVHKGYYVLMKNNNFK